MNRRSFIGKALGLITTVPLLANTDEKIESSLKTEDKPKPKPMSKNVIESYNRPLLSGRTTATDIRAQQYLAEEIGREMSRIQDKMIIEALMKG